MESTAHNYNTRYKDLNKSDHKSTPDKTKNTIVSPSLAQTNDQTAAVILLSSDEAHDGIQLTDKIEPIDLAKEVKDFQLLEA